MVLDATQVRLLGIFDGQVSHTSLRSCPALGQVLVDVDDLSGNVVECLVVEVATLLANRLEFFARFACVVLGLSGLAFSLPEALLNIAEPAERLRQ